MTNRIHLVVIDPENDFCKAGNEIPLPSGLPADAEAALIDHNWRGSLYVEHAHEDMVAAAAFIDNYGDALEDIHVTLDAHRVYDISHPKMYVNSHGENPTPFTLMTYDLLKSGVWNVFAPGMRIKSHSNKTLYEVVLEYEQALEANGKYPHVIWPEHCLIGTRGHALHEAISKALINWEKSQHANVDYVTKGSNFLTEHYSAIEAEVPDPSDPSTMTNTPFIQVISTGDIILLMGEASSHCLANTARDIVRYGGDDICKKLIFLENASSPVTGFEHFTTAWIDEFRAKGMRVSDTLNVYKFF